MPRRKPRGRPLDGWLIIDKPPGLTSTDVVNRVRRAFDAQKAGHGGTLDPLATGVLPIAFGAATKTVPYVMDGTKLYRFTLRFGEQRDTDDADGKITAASSNRPTDARNQRLTPPLSRRHHADPPGLLRGEDRRRACLRHGPRRPRARPGTPPRPRRQVRADQNAPTPTPPSSRSLRARAFTCAAWRATSPRPSEHCGHIAALRRNRVGPFTEAQAIPLDKLRASDDTAPASPDLLLPVVTALADIPALALTETEAAGFRHGQAISLVTLMGRIPGSADPDGGLVRAMAGGRVIGLARLDDGWMKPERML